MWSGWKIDFLGPLLILRKRSLEADDLPDLPDLPDLRDSPDYEELEELAGLTEAFFITIGDLARFIGCCYLGDI